MDMKLKYLPPVSQIVMLAASNTLMQGSLLGYFAVIKDYGNAINDWDNGGWEEL